jgi:hypothetical protein
MNKKRISGCSIKRSLRRKVSTSSAPALARRLSSGLNLKRRRPII